MAADDITTRGWVLCIAAAFSVAVALIRRAIRLRQWLAVFGPKGLGLSDADALAFWRVASVQTRARPHAVLESGDSIAACIEDLGRRGRRRLVRLLLERWSARRLKRHGQLGARGLVVGAHVRVREESGRLLVEGLVRTVTVDAIGILAHDEGAGWPEAGSGSLVVIESDFGVRRTGRLESRHGGMLWRLTFVADAVLAKPKVDVASSRVMLFPPEREIAVVRAKIQNAVPSEHPSRKAVDGDRDVRITHRELLHRRRLLHRGLETELLEVSIDGATVLVEGSGVEWPVPTDCVFLLVDGRLGQVEPMEPPGEPGDDDLLLPAEVVESAVVSAGRTLGLRFVGLSAGELEGLWILVRTFQKDALSPALPLDVPTRA